MHRSKVGRVDIGRNNCTHVSVTMVHRTPEETIKILPGATVCFHKQATFGVRRWCDF